MRAASARATLAKCLGVSVLALAGLLPGGAFAIELTLPPGAEVTRSDVRTNDSYALPTGVFAEDRVPTQTLTGDVTAEAWRIPGRSLPPATLAADLAAQMREAGYDVVLDCADATCGGFDFRFETEVIGEPDMHVDLGDYHVISARRPGTQDDGASILVSRSPNAAFVQLISVEPAGSGPAQTVTSTKTDPIAAAIAEAMPGPVSPPTLARSLEDAGRFILTDLDFASGSAELTAPRYASIADLAGYLIDHPEARVALVGHTDATGSLAANTGLSRARAEAVRQQLISTFGIEAARIEAAGVGYLSPIASNQSEAGRAQNRRVEAILTSTE